MGATNDIPADVRSLIARHVDSVGRLELLLLIFRDASALWSADDLARELRIDPAWTAAELSQLAARGLIERTSEGEWHATATPEIAASVTRVAQAYADRRVSVVALIYAKPSDALRTFADAFRFRKDSQDG